MSSKQQELALVAKCVCVQHFVQLLEVLSQFQALTLAKRHSYGWPPLPPGLTHLHVVVLCIAAGAILISHTNVNVCINPHVALNPLHSTDTLTSHYPLGKYASFLPRTMTSCAMFVKTRQSPNRLAVETMACLREFKICAWCFLFSRPLFFVSPHPLRFLPADGEVLVKNSRAAFGERNFLV